MAPDQSQADKAQRIKENLGSELLADAESAGVDVDETVRRNIEKHEGYDASTVINFVESDIKQQIEAENAETVQGIIMGSRDRYGANWPRRHSVIRSSGEHLEVNSWDGTLPDNEGNEVDIPAGGAKVTFQCDYQQDYDSYMANRLDSAETLEHAELAGMLEKVAVDPEQISAADEESIVAVKGTVSWLQPQSVFEDGEPAGDGEILMTDERGELQPHFEVSLANEEGTSVTGRFSRMAYAKPYFLVTDLFKLLEDAYETYESPKKQAGFVRDGVQGRDVIIVGNVNNYNTNRTDGGEVVNYVNVGATAIVEIPESDGGATAQAEEVDEGDEEEASEPESEGDSPDVDDVAAQIEQYAGLVGEDVADLTTADIVENAGGIEAPESIIEHALKSLSSDDDGGGSDDGQDAADPEERFSSLKESGMFQCPANGCPGKGSSVPDLFDHVIDFHEADGAEEAEEWVESQMG